ncbi:hypothetical protein P691DRAFT_801793 [Macrolepiota fuliginosa MF-IS2]|uniref:Chromatin remodeling factor mit1 n=1 Tax=Macrolepiota fuliginosa MF-IS2 TaxID=1400762 RepID=A0A9P5XB51_9AGAR|nr:hypothetical protein P691DRAFT_801793 [Macrolepiota fuliginosa MF-IS2]
MSRVSSKPHSVVSIPNTPPASAIGSINNEELSLQTQKIPSVYVVLPHFSEEHKAKYKPVKESSLLPNIDEVIGEYESNGILWYFARFKGGIAHRYSAEGLDDYFPELLEVYRAKQIEGTLAPFDPTASYIHPLDRVVLKLYLSSRGGSSLSSLSPLSDSEAYSDDEEYDDDGLPIERPTRRSTRNHRDSQQLPFSPKKARRVVLTMTDDDDEGPSRRRTLRSRQLKLKPVAYEEEDYGESEIESDEDDYRSRALKRRASKGKQRAVAKPRGARPEYGCVKPIGEIELDYFSDDDDRPLRAHRRLCEKCHLGPAHVQLAAWKKRKSRKKKVNSDEDEEDEEDKIERLAGWVRCLKCCVSAHWGCMAQTQRDEVLKAIRERETVKWKEEHGEEGASEPPKRKSLGIQETTDFICGPCTKGGICMGCMETVLKPLGDILAPAPVLKDGEDTVMADDSQQPSQDEAPPNAPSRELLYRCLTCKRLAHYAHLRRPPALLDADLPEVAEHYQFDTAWLCPDCTSYRYPLDKIIAWRPYPPDAVEPPRPRDQPPPYKERLPREYLVKWQDRSYRRLTWVPHMWLVSTNGSKLKHFLSGGTKVKLLDEPVDDGEKKEDGSGEVTFEITACAGAEESRASSARPGAGIATPKLPSDALTDAERWIPPAWKTVDRVLDVVLWVPKRSKAAEKKKQQQQRNKRKQVVVTDDDEEEEEEESEEMKEVKEAIFEDGELPSLENTETAAQWEKRTGEMISMAEIGKVVWVFIKWDDLGYDEASWDSPPRPGEKDYEAFVKAFERYVFSRTVEIPKLSAAHIKQFDNRPTDDFRKKHLLKDAADLQLGQAAGLKLMPFQVDGFNWLCNNWWNHQQCILADEMGLGKTVQVATFLGFIASKWKASPALVVVPNSTITNWVREFERWAPNLRVVPFYGEKKARDVIKKFELFHENYLSTHTPAKFHVLVTTYENITGRDFTTVFKNQDRWEALVVDEGQRLKSDNSLLFRKLNELRSNHRVIMTGTPLNNNIRELFNLMNFLDPKEWSDLEALEKEYADLDEESIKILHNRLRPYFLRRIKSEVLQLPAKNEVIVPVSMAPLQRKVLSSIYQHNTDLMKGVLQSNFLPSGAKGKLNNILMHLRKCLQHPYLYSSEIEPKGLTPQEAHEKLIDASCKLRLLRTLLPKLKERGHRVLLFSQFVIALDIIEDFLTGEGLKYLRLDGNTKGTDRQKGMDEFNRPGSDVFIYLLTTRAGGVGINLFSADTVIIFDPDFNPHQDLQAIARAYRYGQKKTCLVFKLMVKKSPEERIMQIGKKKLVLDHLIVQKINDDEDGVGENIQSILTYGAQSLFDDEENSRDTINYSDQDILRLIEKTEVEGEQEDKPKEGMSFSFAKIWAADKDTLEDIGDNEEVDSWAQTLEKFDAERTKQVMKEEAESGRGRGRGRRKAATIANKKIGVNETPDKPEMQPKPKKGGKKAPKSDGSGSAYTASDGEESIDEEIAMGGVLLDDEGMDVEELRRQVQRNVHLDRNYNPDYAPGPASRTKVHPSKDSRPAAPVHPPCGLCGERHGGGFGECEMTDSSANLAEYREILILHAEDEDWETRNAAIRAIDEVLWSRGHLSLIAGQPLHPIKPQQQLNRSTLVNDSIPSQQVPQPPQFQRSAPRTQMQAHRGPQAPTASSSRFDISNSASNSVRAPSGPGSSKRPGSPSGETMRKKAKVPIEMSCPVCGASPPHLLKDCGVVLAGSRSISQQIERLERSPGRKDIVDILRKFLSKAKSREMGTEMQ